ncbi:Ubiquitin-like protease domain-containing protein [Abeliophyllum distichum]|uniref:Ubiquitin-like protease domain-containing protein n=1 Tax=Abeliophyllum distichum TaxID=126358 RepID=A0ABD1PU51_9LAMI
MDEKIAKRSREILPEESPSQKKKEIMQHEAQDWDYRIDRKSWPVGRIMVSPKIDVIGKLNAKLKESQKQLFKETCFGPFLDMKDIRLQHQLIHKMLLREVMQPNYNEMWFKIGEKHVRFSMEEFCIVTGLKCTGSSDISEHVLAPISLKTRYFSDLRAVYKKDVESVFLNLPNSTNDEDVVKLGILYLLSSYLFTTTYAKQVSDSTMRLVDLDESDSFPWGKELFNTTFTYLKSALNTKADDEGIITYRLCGFPIAFQVWIYETLPLDGILCEKIRDSWPRIINWTTDKRIMSSQLEDNMFDSFEAKSFETCEDEKEAPYCIQMFEEASAAPTHDNNKDVLDPPARQRKKLSAAPMCNEPPNVVESKEKEDSKSHYNEDIINRLTDVQIKQEQMLHEMMSFKHGVESMIADFRKEVIERFKQISSPKAGERHLDNKVDEKGSEFKSTNENDVVENFDNEETDLDSPKGNEFVDVKVHERECALSEKEQPLCEDNLPSFDLGIDFTPNDIFPRLSDGSFYTDEVLENVDKTIDEVHIPDTTVADQNMPGMPTKRPHKPNTLLQSPYLLNYGSSSDVPQSHVQLCAFEAGFIAPRVADIDSFEKWYREGHRPNKIGNKFIKRAEKIVPAFNFGPITISEKQWFHDLRENDATLEDTHMDVCFYYLRKMVKYSNTINLRVTTTDCLFGSLIRKIFKTISVDDNAIADEVTLLEYPLGDYMHCNTPWRDIDHVLMPIMMEDHAHWILGHFDLNKKCLNIYNSYGFRIKDRQLVEDVQAFAVVIPHLLVNIGFWKSNLVDGKEHIEPLDVNIIQHLPQQQNGFDCGIFVIEFAKHIINQTIESMPNPLDCSTARINLATQLFKHGFDKQRNGYDTDRDNVARKVRKARRLKRGN